MRKPKETVSQVPRLMAEWDFEANSAEGLFPEQLGSQSNREASWKCEYGHKWKSKISNRYHGRGCPECNKRLKTSFPEQAVFFYVRKLFPDAVSGYKPEFLNRMELDIFIPELMLGIEYDGKAWHTDANRERDLRKYALCQENGIELWRIKEELKQYTPLDVPADMLFSTDDMQDKEKLGNLISQLIFYHLYPRSKIYDAWYFCHLISPVDVDIKRDEFEIREYQSILRQGSFKDKYPEAADSWHPTKNGNLRPDMFAPNSMVKAWWICELGHEWRTSFAVRARGNGCPYCSGQKVLAGFNDLGTRFPEVAKEWDYRGNGGKTPSMFTGGSSKKVSWVCKEGHRYEARIANRTTKGQGCPYCAHEKPIVGENDLATLYPQIAAEWHPTKNGEKRPQDFLPSSNKKVWWKCSECEYEYQTMITNRTKGTGCKRCAGQVLIPGVNDLASQYPEIAAEWDYERNEGVQPNQVFSQSNKTYAWKDRYGHTWMTSPNARVRGTGCPYCSGNEVWEGFNDLATTHPQIAAEWHPRKNGSLLPTQVSKGYTKKVWFLCPDCDNSYDTYIGNKIKGYGKCPYCSPRKTRAKNVLQVETGLRFKTLKEAAKSVGREDYRQIHMCCVGRCKTAHGFHWEYVEEDESCKNG